MNCTMILDLTTSRWMRLLMDARATRWPTWPPRRSGPTRPGAVGADGVLVGWWAACVLGGVLTVLGVIILGRMIWGASSNNSPRRLVLRGPDAASLDAGCWGRVASRGAGSLSARQVRTILPDT